MLTVQMNRTVTVTDNKVDTCIHYVVKLSKNVTLTVPTFNFTRCSVSRASNELFDQAPYCWNYIDQTNCTDIERVGGYCEVNGYISSVSKFMVCNEYDQRTKFGIKLCDDKIQNVCFVSPNSGCKIHRHKMCDEIKDCSDGSDEVNDLCSTVTDKFNFKCTRRFKPSKGEYNIPVSWMMDNVIDCLDGEDENPERLEFCQRSENLKEILIPGESCQNVFMCSKEQKSFVPFDKLCDGIESCDDGEENKVCRIARDFPDLRKAALKNGTMLTVCNASISTCEVKEFRKPWGGVFGEPRRNMYFPTSKVDCSEHFGEEYLFLSCMNLCTEEKATCPLINNNRRDDRILEYNSCPGQYQNRTYTLANNSFLTFLVMSDEHGQYHQDFYKCNNSKCVEYRKVCDLVDDCGDMSDEINCTNHMVCKNTLVNQTKHHFISFLQKCDGVHRETGDSYRELYL